MHRALQVGWIYFISHNELFRLEKTSRDNVTPSAVQAGPAFCAGPCQIEF